MAAATMIAAAGTSIPCTATCQGTVLLPAARQQLACPCSCPSLRTSDAGRLAGVAGGSRSDVTAPRRSLAVRCQIASWLPTTSQQSHAENMVATVLVLKEGAFDVASHALSDLLGQKLQMFLVSTELNPETKEPKLSPAADIKFNNKDSKDVGRDSLIQILFRNVPKDFGLPGAVLVESYHDNEFFLKSVTLDAATPLHFPCNSWIMHHKHNSYRPRIFFTNQACLPKDTPEALQKLRDEDLMLLRGDGKGQRVNAERIYDYDVYNDLGSPDKDEALARPTLGGSSDLPYPRRCRTGRKRCEKDKSAEVPVTFDDGYIPRDERFSPWKKSLFLSAAVKCFGQEVLPVLRGLVDAAEFFECLHDIHEIFEGSLRSVKTVEQMLKHPLEGSVIQFPRPGVVQANKEGWLHDVEFGRQRLAGANPLCIELLKDLSIRSELDPHVYGPAESSIRRNDIEVYLEGFSVDEAIAGKRMFILDYHDALMPYVNKINQGKDGKIYASRTIFFLTRMNVLVPIIIELSLPPSEAGGKGCRRVVLPPPPGYTNWSWHLAKSHVAAADAGVHQLVSHWLRTHACMEPFIIATHRQLSTMHPLHVLLSPHFKDTMNINAMARTCLINAHGIIEKAFTPGAYCSEISSVFYKSWRFDEQALPNDMLKRGMAEADPTAKHGIKLVLDDYPYAKDGLEVWGVIEDWVKDYVAIYYKSDEDAVDDKELQAWWKEITEVGHEDHKGASWWGDVKKIDELVQVLTTIIWVASAHHSAVNFGQYAYSGFMPNSPSICHKLIPEPESKEHDKFLADPEKYYLSSVSSHGQATLVTATVEILAQHLEDEEYLGQRSDAQWTSDPRALQSLELFQASLKEVEARIQERNEQAIKGLFHRAGPVLLPYTLLSPLPGGVGLTFRGVPNSISI